LADADVVAINIAAWRHSGYSGQL